MKEHVSSGVPSFPLFVPADRPERFAKACAAGTDSVIIDLEDAVPAQSKVAARRIPHGLLPTERTVQLYLRVNGTDTPWYADDVAFARITGFDGVVLPKTESAAQIDALRAALAPGCTIMALVETVAGVAAIHEIAPARAAFRPATDEVVWAQQVLAASNDGTTTTVKGAMVDAPVVVRATRILERERAMK